MWVVGKWTSAESHAEHSGADVKPKKRKRGLSTVKGLRQSAPKSASWGKVGLPKGMMLSNEQDSCALYTLDEIDSIQVEYETDGRGGKVVKLKNADTGVHLSCNELFKVDDDAIEVGPDFEPTDPNDQSILEEDAPKGLPVDVHPEMDNHNNSLVQTSQQADDMGAWSSFGLSDLLLQGLRDAGFVKPTMIQSQMLPHGLSGKEDVIAAAPTGSGKTLAFGLCLLELECQKNSRNHPTSLVMVPTRELAGQISAHLSTVSKYLSVNIVSLVGGVSIQKQKRLLQKQPNIIVATPGRLWELMENDDGFMTQVSMVQTLVIDEADRMLESGHYKELSNIMRILREANTSNRQVFVTSATMAGVKGLHSNLAKQRKADDPFARLVSMVPFQNGEPIYINCVASSFVGTNLRQSVIELPKTEKDLYLYYLLLRYPGKTMVFVNSISLIRRLVPLLKLLQLPVFSFHAEMEQRQRFKNIERFSSEKESILITTDVAARGIDVPAVDHVVHYQLPRTADVYVHRSGRTARADRPGVSVVLCSPEEKPLLSKIRQVLGTSEAISEFPVELSYLPALNKRLGVAIQIEKKTHSLKKANSEQTWMKKMAESADIMIESAGGKSDPEEMNDKDDRAMASLKLQLAGLLSRKLLQKGVSHSYLTSGGGHERVEAFMENLDSGHPFLPSKKQKAIDALSTAVGSSARKMT